MIRGSFLTLFSICIVPSLTFDYSFCLQSYLFSDVLGLMKVEGTSGLLKQTTFANDDRRCTETPSRTTVGRTLTLQATVPGNGCV